jgi:hypothetical protein
MYEGNNQDGSSNGITRRKLLIPSSPNHPGVTTPQEPTKTPRVLFLPSLLTTKDSSANILCVILFCFGRLISSKYKEGEEECLKNI